MLLKDSVFFVLSVMIQLLFNDCQTITSVEDDLHLPFPN
jgi:hypothetical protein